MTSRHCPSVSSFFGAVRSIPNLSPILEPMKFARSVSAPARSTDTIENHQMSMSRIVFAVVCILLCGAMVNALPPARTPRTAPRQFTQIGNMRQQYAPRVKYGGHRPRYVAPPPRSYVYQRWSRPPAASLTQEATASMDAMNANRGREVDWNDFTAVSDCPHCPNRHAGGNCVPAKGRARPTAATDLKRKR